MPSFWTCYLFSSFKALSSILHSWCNAIYPAILKKHILWHHLCILGWFARDPVVLKKVGWLLLQQPEVEHQKPRQVLIAEDCFKLSSIPSERLTQAFVNSVKKLFGGESTFNTSYLHRLCLDECIFYNGSYMNWNLILLHLSFLLVEFKRHVGVEIWIFDLLVDDICFNHLSYALVDIHFKRFICSRENLLKDLASYFEMSAIS